MSTPAPAMWQEIPIGEILHYLNDRVNLDASREYVTITVKRRHGGLEERDHLFGHQIKSGKQFRVIPGAFIISRVQCWHEAYAIVPDGISPNMIASANYDQFSISPKVDSRFFWWLSHSPRFRETVRSSAFGVVIEKMVFNRDEWLKKTLPIPPLSVQRRIVTRIDELTPMLDHARSLRREAEGGARAFAASYASYVFAGEKVRRWPEVRLADVCSSITDGTHQTPHYVDEGMPFLSAQNVKPFRFMPENYRCVSLEDYKAYTRHTKAEKGDVLMTRVGAMIGEAALIDRDFDFAFYVSLCLMKPNPELLYGSYLVFWLNSPFGMRATREKTFGKGHSQGNLNLKLIREFVLPLPPVADQKQIVVQLESMRSKVDSLIRCQSETSGVLDALLPSVLDGAFRGEL